MVKTISNHIYKVCREKGIDHRAVIATLQQSAEGTYRVITSGKGVCHCGANKHEHNGYNLKLDKDTIVSVAVIVCHRCSVAITCYLPDSVGATPLRPDQPQQSFRTKCEDCGKKFVVTARTWEDLHKQTNHRCVGGKFTDLIADEHRHLRGVYDPKNKG